MAESEASGTGAGARGSRQVLALARGLGLDEGQAARLAQAAPDLLATRALDPLRLARESGIDRETADRLRQAARLTALPGLAPFDAGQLVRAGLNLDGVARSEPKSLAEALRRARLEGTIPAETRTEWPLAAARLARDGHAERRAPGDIPSPPARQPAPLRQLTVDEPLDLNALARKHYDLDRANPEAVVRALTLANARQAGDVVDAGTRLVLPVLPEAPLRPLDALAKELAGFAVYLDDQAALRLAEAGFQSPAALAYLQPERDAPLLGVPGETLRRLQLQSTLGQVASIPGEAAHALAAVSDYQNALEMANANPKIVARHLLRAAGLGLLEHDQRWSEVAISGWLLDLGDILGSLGGWRFTPVDTICAPAAQPTTSPENFYSFRLTPPGQNATALAGEREDRLRLFNKLAEALLDPDIKADNPVGKDKGKQLEREVLRACDLTWADLEKWGLDPLTNTKSAERLGNLQRYLGEQRIILDLLTRLAEAHEAYNRGEYQIALATYQAVKRWFDTRGLENLLGAVQPLSLLWSNRTQGGNLVSSFVEPQPAGLGNTEWETWKSLALGDLHSYYLGRAQPSKTLDDLQVTFDDYNKMMLHPFDQQLKIEEPFRKHLYYIRNFSLPLATADIHQRLGHFCQALEDCFRVGVRPEYTEMRAAADESIMARRLPAGSTYPAIDETGFDPTGYNQYYVPYLHPIERRVVDLRIAHIYREWGEHHERRAQPWLPNDPDTRQARARYAQSLRVVFPDWQNFRDASFAVYDDFQTQLLASQANPLALDHAFAVDLGLLRMDSQLNFLGFSPNYVPVWTYNFLLNSARYFAGQAKQLERDGLSFLASAEQELGNQRLLVQQAATAASQFDVESRRVDEAQAGIAVAQAGLGLAEQRLWNSLNRRIELEALGPVRVALGVVGGVMSGAGSGAGVSGGNPYAIAGGAGLGGVTSYLSGQIELDMQLNELGRQELEMGRGRGLALAELGRGQISASVARMVRNIAAANLAFAQSNLAFALTKQLNADFWFETSKRLRDFAQRYLFQAIQIAFMAEQAFEFMEGRRVDRIKFDYASREEWLAADGLLSDLDSIEAERVVGQRSKRMPVRHVVNLRQRDFQAFEFFRRTGRITFDTFISEFDLDYPGSYMRRIVDVEVEVFALAGPGGIRGSLTKRGLSYVRFRDPDDNFTPGLGNVASDWIQYTPSVFRSAPLLHPDETLILSSFDIRRDQVVLRGQPPGEELGVFEGSGLGTTWQLTLSPCNNDFDLSTMTDVNVIFYYTAQFDPQLTEIIGLERRKLIGLGAYRTQRTRGYSFGESLPDHFYHLKNPTSGPAAAALRRRVMFEIRPAEFPPNEVNRMVNSLVLAFVGQEKSLKVQPRLSSARHSPAYDPALDNQNNLAWVPNAGESIDTDSSLPYVVMATQAFNGQSPDDLWFLEIAAEDNPDLALTDAGGATLRFRLDASGDLVLDAARQPIPDPAGALIFDPAKLEQIKDVWWVFRYNYEIGGQCGDPIVLWSHFSMNDQAHFAGDETTPHNASWQSASLTGASNWAHGDNRLRHMAGGSGLALPVQAFDWSDVELKALVHLPDGNGREVGIVIRCRDNGGAKEFYRLRLINQAADVGRVDVCLDKVQSATVTLLAERTKSGLQRDADHQLGLFARGDTLQAFVDGVPLLSVQDGDIASGTAGLYATGVGASCSDLWVSDLNGRP